MSDTQSKITSHVEKQEHITHNQKTQQFDTSTEQTSIIQLTGKTLKLIIDLNLSVCLIK